MQEFRIGAPSRTKKILNLLNTQKSYINTFCIPLDSENLEIYDVKNEHIFNYLQQ